MPSIDQIINQFQFIYHLYEVTILKLNFEMYIILSSFELKKKQDLKITL